MSSNSSISTASNAKYFAKKKRGNKSAKLKQCKLDVRRQQWLLQVKNKGEQNGVGEMRDPDPPMHASRELGLEFSPTNREKDCCMHNLSDSDSASNCHTAGSVMEINFSGTNFSRSFSSGTTSYSENISDDGGLDDWEAIADALMAATDDNKDEPNQNLESLVETKNVTQLDYLPEPEVVNQPTSSADMSKPKPENTQQTSSADMSKPEIYSQQTSSADMSKPKPKPKPEIYSQQTSSADMSKPKPEINSRKTSSADMTKPKNIQAWRRHDDFRRPQCLPNLLKQHSFPMKSSRHYLHKGTTMGCKNSVSAPSTCPICCEDLDITDLSFLPCSCGFQLCLFCHKRILEEDGRCPGCRKHYDNNAAKWGKNSESDGVCKFPAGSF